MWVGSCWPWPSSIGACITVCNNMNRRGCAVLFPWPKCGWGGNAAMPSTPLPCRTCTPSGSYTRLHRCSSRACYLWSAGALFSFSNFSHLECISFRLSGLLPAIFYPDLLQFNSACRVCVCRYFSCDCLTRQHYGARWVSNTHPVPSGTRKHRFEGSFR